MKDHHSSGLRYSPGQSRTVLVCPQKIKGFLWKRYRNMGIFDRLFGRKEPSTTSSPSPKLPKCSSCGRDIPPMETTIAEDIRRGGGVVVGRGALDQVLYKGTICRNCGRMYCLSCHDFKTKGYRCPNCGSALSPLFADYIS